MPDNAIIQKFYPSSFCSGQLVFITSEGLSIFQSFIFWLTWQGSAQKEKKWIIFETVSNRVPELRVVLIYYAAETSLFLHVLEQLTTLEGNEDISPHYRMSFIKNIAHISYKDRRSGMRQCLMITHQLSLAAEV